LIEFERAAKDVAELRYPLNTLTLEQQNEINFWSEQIKQETKRVFGSKFPAWYNFVVKNGQEIL
jgi:hypothetical protein